MTKRSTSMAVATLTFLGVSILISTVGNIIMDRQFAEEQKQFEDMINNQTEQDIKKLKKILEKQADLNRKHEQLKKQLEKQIEELKKKTEESRKKSSYELIYEEFLENRRKMMNGEL